MTQLLFLLSPVFIGGLYLLMGETLHLAKKEHLTRRTDKTKALIHAGRE